jgi:hypothetical protein
MKISKRIIACFYAVLLLLAAVGCTAGGRTPAVGMQPSSSLDLQMIDAEKQTGDTTGQESEPNTVQHNEQAVPTNHQAAVEKSGQPQATDRPSEQPTQKTQENATATAPSETSKPTTASKPDDRTASDYKTSAAVLSDEDSTVCTIAIYGDGNTILKPTSVKFKEGDSVLDILKKVTRSGKIQMEYRGGEKSGAYVEGIDNLYEFDRGAESGWMYNVNGKYPNCSCGVYTVKKGDVIEWRYTKDLGKDLGVDMKNW